VIVREGIDTSVFDPAAVSPERIAAVRRSWGLGEGDPRPVLLLAGRLAAWKGHRLMVETLAGLPAAREVLW